MLPQKNNHNKTIKGLVAAWSEFRAANTQSQRRSAVSRAHEIVSKVHIPEGILSIDPNSPYQVLPSAVPLPISHPFAALRAAREILIPAVANAKAALDLRLCERGVSVGI